MVHFNCTSGPSLYFHPRLTHNNDILLDYIAWKAPQLVMKSQISCASRFPHIIVPITSSCCENKASGLWEARGTTHVRSITGNTTWTRSWSRGCLCHRKSSSPSKKSESCLPVEATAVCHKSTTRCSSRISKRANVDGRSSASRFLTPLSPPTFNSSRMNS